MPTTFLTENFDTLDTNLWSLNGGAAFQDGKLYCPPGSSVNCLKAFPENLKVTLDIEMQGLPVNTDNFVGNCLCLRVGGHPIWIQLFPKMGDPDCTQFCVQIKDTVTERTFKNVDLAKLTSKNSTSFKIERFGLAVRGKMVTAWIGDELIDGFVSNDFTKRDVGQFYLFGAGALVDSYIDNLVVTNK